MAKNKKKAKKEIRQKISDQLLVTFEHLKKEIGERKFKRNIREASKILVAGIKPAKTEKKATTKKLKKVSPAEAI